jgi:hypothetical protein
MDVMVTKEIIPVLLNLIARTAWQQNWALTRMTPIQRAAKNCGFAAAAMAFFLFFAVPAAFGSRQLRSAIDKK